MDQKLINETGTVVRLQFRLKTVLLLVTLLTMVFWGVYYQLPLLSLDKQIASAREIMNAPSAEDAGVQRQRDAIRLGFESTDTNTIAKPTIAFAAIWEFPDRALVIDWICIDDQFKSVTCEMQNGDIIFLSSEKWQTESNDYFYHQSSIPLERVLKRNLSETEIKSVAIIKSDNFKSKPCLVSWPPIERSELYGAAHALNEKKGQEQKRNLDEKRGRVQLNEN